MQINIYVENFYNELRKFKEWVDGDLRYYLSHTAKSNGEVYKFKKNLIKATEKLIDILNIDLSYCVKDILYVLAIDNEEENILTYITNSCNKNQLDLIIQKGYKFFLYETRWQIAEIIKKRYLTEYEKYLACLKKDKNIYVRKRAD